MSGFFLLAFAVLLVVVLAVYWPLKRARDRRAMEEMAEQEAAADAMGYGALEEFEAATAEDAEAWRGDEHPESDW